MAPVLSFLISSTSKKKEPRFVCLSAAKASHSHKTWTELNKCARVYRLHTTILSDIYIIYQLHVSALMAIFRLDTKSDEKLYIIWYITYMRVV